MGQTLQDRIDADKPDLSTLGGRIRYLRLHKLKMDQPAFCKAIRAGKDIRRLRRWELTEHAPKTVFIVRMAKLAGVSTDWILTGKGAR